MPAIHKTRSNTPVTTGDHFGLSDVALVLTGEEWTTVIARLCHRPLSKMGEEIYKRASIKIQQQLLRAANNHRKGAR